MYLIIVFTALVLEKAPQGASVPALGLSNKPVYQVEDQNKDKTAAAVSKTGVSDQYVENYFTPTLLDGTVHIIGS